MAAAAAAKKVRRRIKTTRKIPKKKRDDHYDHHHLPLAKIKNLPFAKYRCNSGIFGICLLMCTMIVTNKINGVTIEIHSFLFLSLR